MKRRVLLLFIILLTLASCVNRNGARVDHEVLDTMTVRYARGFSVEYCDGFTRVNVRNPWDTTKLLHRYILVKAGQPRPDSLPEGTVIEVPLKRVIAYSSVHCGMMEEMGVRDELVGVCEARYFDLDFVKQGLSSGRIVDLGETASPNVEKLIAAKSQAIIISPIENVSYGRVEKVGLPLIECVDYMELTPLGRAEWIRFLALFFDRQTVADSVFNNVVTAYNEVKSLVAGVSHKPRVLAETKTGAVWYVPGAQSYIANLYADAGAEHLWQDVAGSGSVPQSFESVLERGVDADLWLMKYNSEHELSYKGLRDELDAYQQFAPYKKRAIFTCNTGKTKYYEEMPIHPEYLLKDMVWIFHPELLPDYTPRYYRKMQE